MRTFSIFFSIVTVAFACFMIGMDTGRNVVQQSCDATINSCSSLVDAQSSAIAGYYTKLKECQQNVAGKWMRDVSYANKYDKIKICFADNDCMVLPASDVKQGVLLNLIPMEDFK